MSPTDEVIRAVCDIPRRFRQGGLSFVDLMRASGYRERTSTIIVEQLRAHLEREPALVDDWLQWSEDKRTSEGWYFLRAEVGGIIGWVGKDTAPETEFDSVAEACARFILLELAGAAERAGPGARTT